MRRKLSYRNLKYDCTADSALNSDEFPCKMKRDKQFICIHISLAPFCIAQVSVNVSVYECICVFVCWYSRSIHCHSISVIMILHNEMTKRTPLT